MATKGTVKGLTARQLGDIGVQLSFVNTYHLVTHPGTPIIRAAGGIHRMSGMQRTLMSDSGGFQVFSLAQKSRRAKLRGEEEPILLKIDESGVIFRSLYDGSTIEFTPEQSMDYQRDIGADINMAFDECTYHPATHDYTATSMERTHAWLKRCISHRSTHTLPEYRQYLYGIIQGGVYEDLRITSARHISQQNIDGVAIGGVSVGESKQDMRDQVRWVAPYLPEDKPVHLLGVGHLDDIRDLVSAGIDTFDCVEPSRLARLGVIIQIEGLENKPEDWIFHEIDVTAQVYRDNISPIDVLVQTIDETPFTYAYLHHLFKQKELLGYTLATYYNLIVMERYMGRIRECIETGLL